MSADVYITAHAAVTGTSWDCYAVFDGLGVSDPYVVLSKPASGQTLKRTVTMSGKMGVNGRREFNIGGYCGGSPRPPVTIALDNIRISTLAAEIGSSPTEFEPLQILKNGDFSGPTLDPWASWTTLTTNQSVKLVDGAAVVQMAPMTRSSSQSIGIIQRGLAVYELGQTARVTGKATLKFPGDLVTGCTLFLSAASTTMWTSPNVNTTSTFEVDARKTLESNGELFIARFACNSPFPYVAATPQVIFDDLTFTINA